MRKKIFGLLFLVLISLTGFVVAHNGVDDSGHYSMMMGDYGYGMMFFGWFVGILVLVVLVLLVAWLVKEIQKK